MEFWNANPHVPEYINKMEDSQKKASRAGLPITDDWLIAIISTSLLSAGSFPKQRPDWDGLAATSKDWALWKTTCRATQITIDQEQ